MERPLVKFRMFDFGNPAARQFMIDSISHLIDKGRHRRLSSGLQLRTRAFLGAGGHGRSPRASLKYATRKGWLAFWTAAHRITTYSRYCSARGSGDNFARRGSEPGRLFRFTRCRSYWSASQHQGLANSRSTSSGTLLQVRPRDTYHFRSGMAPGLAFALFNVAGYPNQVGSLYQPIFRTDWMRTMVAQLKLVRPYYYGDYYPLLPCSLNSDCSTDPSKERSAAFEWAALAVQSSRAAGWNDSGISPRRGCGEHKESCTAGARSGKPTRPPISTRKQQSGFQERT